MPALKLQTIDRPSWTPRPRLEARCLLSKRSGKGEEDSRADRSARTPSGKSARAPMSARGAGVSCLLGAKRSSYLLPVAVPVGELSCRALELGAPLLLDTLDPAVEAPEPMKTCYRRGLLP